ncbi:MAG: tripartite tricarboxylate transporter substrate binding protein [Burkholderiales bacterium]|nr:tripartite tricarboxylate transporter substrate binding protein [Burkholderiales bacterium]
MSQPKRFVLCWLAGMIAGGMCWVPDTLAQSYPVKPIRMIVGYAPGGGTDVTARLIAQKISENLGQNMLVENRPGASGFMAIERVAPSPPDGYTLLMMTSNDTVLPALRPNLPIDLERDFAPVSLVTIGPLMLLVNPSVPARDVKELVALARAKRGQLNYGSPGIGTSPHLAGALFNLMAKVDLAHVPYKSSADSVVAAAVGDISTCFASVTAALPLLNSAKLRGLAVTSANRVSSVPSVPTLDESGLAGYDRSSWYGVLAPARTPNPVIERLNLELGKVLSTAEMREALVRQGLVPKTNTPAQFAAFIHTEITESGKLIKLTGARAD